MIERDARALHALAVFVDDLAGDHAGRRARPREHDLDRVVGRLGRRARVGVEAFAGGDQIQARDARDVGDGEMPVRAADREPSALVRVVELVREARAQIAREMGFDARAGDGVSVRIDDASGVIEARRDDDHALVPRAAGAA